MTGGVWGSKRPNGNHGFAFAPCRTPGKMLFAARSRYPSSFLSTNCLDLVSFRPCLQVSRTKPCLGCTSRVSHYGSLHMIVAVQPPKTQGCHKLQRRPDGGSLSNCLLMISTIPSNALFLCDLQATDRAKAALGARLQSLRSQSLFQFNNCTSNYALGRKVRRIFYCSTSP